MEINVIAAILSVLAGSLLPLLNQLVKELRDSSKCEKFFASSFGESLLQIFDLNKSQDTPGKMFTELSETSRKMDGIVSKIQAYTKMRESAVNKLEIQLENLTQEEGQRRKTIEELQKVPLPAAEYFASLVGKENKRGVMRDYILFVAGVLVSAIVTILLKHFGWA